MFWSATISNDPYSDYLNSIRKVNGECTCPCNETRDSYCRYMTGSCYQPICPVGTYLCCVTCMFATCMSTADLALSTRGRRECIVCPPGHFCSGCDLPQRCPPNTINPHLGMSKAEQCKLCQSGFTATKDATQCCYNGNMCSEPAEGSNYLLARSP